MHRSTFDVVPRIILTLLAVQAGRVAAQGGGILDGVRFSEERGATIVTIDLSERVRYVSHASSPSGTVLQVRLHRLGSSPGDTVETAGRDRLVPAGYESRIVQEITYEGGAADDGTLILRFPRPVQPTVRQRSDQQSISISFAAALDPTGTPRPDAGAQASATAATSADAATSGGGDSDAGDLSQPPPSPMALDPNAPMATVMDEGRRAMIAKNYGSAVRLFTKVLQAGDPAFRQEAKELLGVAQEKSKHLAHAKAEYEEYLRLYPTGEGAERVRQRLAAMLASAPERPDASAPAAPSARNWVKDFAGSFSQFLRRDSSILDGDGEVINQSYLASDLDVTGRVRTGDYDLRTQFSGGYRLDIEGSSSSSNLRMRYLYVDATDRRHSLNARVGRQSRSTGGVLGRFDGAVLNYRLTPRTRLNLVGGFPVDLTSANSLDADRYFYGLSADFGTFADCWDFSGFAIEQRAEGMLDRRAIGGELRYVRPEASFFTLVDFDVSYLALNILLLQGSYRFASAATLGIAFDYRDTPALTTNNALIGQPYDSLDELRDVYDNDEIRDLAEDRTQRSWSVTLSGSQPLTQRLQISADFTVANLSDTPESGGVEETPSSGEEYTVSTQVIGSDIVQSGDVQIVGLRYSNTEITDTGSIMLNSRFPLDPVRLNPRLQFDLQGRSESSVLSIVKPSLLVDFRWRNALTFEIEAGYEWAEEISGSTGSSRQGYYLYAGYRWDF